MAHLGKANHERYETKRVWAQTAYLLLMMCHSLTWITWKHWEALISFDIRTVAAGAPQSKLHILAIQNFMLFH